MNKPYNTLKLIIAVIALIYSCSSINHKRTLNTIKCSNEKDPKMRVDCLTNVLHAEPDNTSRYFERAETYIELFRYSDAIADYLKIIELEPGNMNACYNIARLASLIYSIDYSIYWLEKAFDTGFNDYEQILNDPFFKNIRATEKFKILMKEKYSNILSMPTYNSNIP